MTKIGLEIHAQLNTKSKLFCYCKNQTSDSPPNSNTCPICLGMPGSRPLFNKEVLRKAIQVSLALNNKMNKKMFFSRKSYFYPDMSKNFQITQYELPVSENGFINFKTGNKEVRVGIRRVHIEEDPGKLMHKGGNIMKSEYTLVDYNRSGAPLLEIVTEPDMKTPEQARHFLQMLRNVLEHLSVITSESTFKVDCNVSIDDGERVEIKNVTGMKNVERALKFEIRRLESSKKMNIKIVQHTRHYDEKRGVTLLLRIKETAEDYGYIFEPDLPWYNITNELVSKIENEMPELPYQRIQRFVKDYKLTLKESEVIILADKYIADMYEDIVKEYKNPKKVSNFMCSQLLKILNFNKKRLVETGITSRQIIELFMKVDNGTISERLLKELVKKQEFIQGKPMNGYEKINDTELIRKHVFAVIKENKNQVEEYKLGKKQVFNYLIGECLKKLEYKAEMKNIREELEKALNN